MKFWQMVSYVEIDQLEEVAKIAEDVGFEGVLGTDHAVFPKTLHSTYPYTPDGVPPVDSDTPYPDPWVTTAVMMAATRRLKFSTAVYVLPLRNPIEVANATAALSLVSRGRFILGAGVGWMKEEFDAYGVDFHKRGRRMDSTIDVLRKLWGGDWVEHRDEFFHYEGVKITPAPAGPIPIYTGGSSDAALERAAKLAQGWIGPGSHPDEVPPLMQKLAALRREHGRSGEPFETIVGLTTPPDPETFKRLEERGMTSGLNYPFNWLLGRGSTLDEKRRVMEEFAEKFIVKPA